MEVDQEIFLSYRIANGVLTIRSFPIIKAKLECFE